jgi:octaprenyl-diphosphate synthase
MLELAKKVKKGFVKDEEIHQLVKFAIDNGGIDYAVKRMDDFSGQAQRYIDFHVKQFDIKQSLQTYLNFVANRNN